MLSFSISNHVSRKEYIRFVLGQTYRKWYILVLGGLCILAALLYLSEITGILHIYKKAPIGNLGFAAYFLIILPLYIWYMSGKYYSKNLRLQQTIRYTFAERNITIKGEDFEERYAWKDILRIKETKEYLLLYVTTTAELIRKDHLTDEQLTFILKSVTK